MGVDPEIVIRRGFGGLHRDRGGGVATLVPAGCLARRERVDQPIDHVIVGIPLGERLDERVEGVPADEHVSGDGDAAFGVDLVAKPSLTSLTGDGVGVAVCVEAVDLAKVGVIVAGQQAVERVVDSEIGQQRDAAPAQPDVDEALCCDDAVVADARCQRADRRCVGRNPDSEGGSRVGRLADADRERHARFDDVVADNAFPG